MAYDEQTRLGEDYIYNVSAKQLEDMWDKRWFKWRKAMKEIFDEIKAKDRTIIYDKFIYEFNDCFFCTTRYTKILMKELQDGL